MSALRPKLTYANIMATVAVFIALGGASYAATQLPKNSVGSKQLKKNSVITAKIKKEAVTATKVKKRTLTATQIDVSKLGTVPSADRAATAGDSNTLQGRGPSGFIHGDGSVIFSRLDLDEGATAVPLMALPGIGNMTAKCQPGKFGVGFENTSGETIDVALSEENNPSSFYALKNGQSLETQTIIGRTEELQIATRGATPASATINASLSFTGPKACTAFAQATLAK